MALPSVSGAAKFRIVHNAFRKLGHNARRKPKPIVSEGVAEDIDTRTQHSSNAGFVPYKPDHPKPGFLPHAADRKAP